MRRILLFSFLLIAFLAALRYGRRGAPPRAAVPEPADRGGEVRAAGLVRIDSVTRARKSVLQRIAASDTYLPAMLVQSDSVLKRWSDRTRTPLAVYLPASDVPGYTAELDNVVRTAFHRWERVAGIPVFFAFVRDSSRADVMVRWIREFPIERTGQADVRWNGAGWLLSGTLTLATQNAGGVILPPSAVYTVALHEIGHLLGLGHSDSPADVMYPTTEIRVDITVRDRQTARLLYDLPPGSLRLP